MADIWVSDCQINKEWIRERIFAEGSIETSSAKQDIVDAVDVQDISNANRKGNIIRNGTTLRLFVKKTKDIDRPEQPVSSDTFIMKQVPSGNKASLVLSRQLGLAREAMFFKHLGPKIEKALCDWSKQEGEVEQDVGNEKIIPKIYYSWGNIETGEKVIIMEDLSSSDFIDSGVLFGPCNPNNRSRDLKGMLNQAYHSNNTIPPTSFEVANMTFMAVARIHAMFWNDDELLKYDWLRGSSWIKDAFGSGEGDNKGRKSWAESQGLIQQIWNKYKKETLNDSTDEITTPRQAPMNVQWDPLVLQIVQKAMDGISWASQEHRLNRNKTQPWTLVHGDFWPGNVLISTSLEYRELRLLDWEMVGIGSGPQELGQYIISNMDPSERRSGNEKQLIRNYYDELVRCFNAINRGKGNNVSGERIMKLEYTWEECWEEYKIGGLERWIWFLVYFCGQENMVEWAKFFHNQIAEFVKDHHLTPDDVTQPRP